MNRNELAKELGLQTYAIVSIGIRCNRCERVHESSYPHTSLAAYQLAQEGWTIDDACQVSCPECGPAEAGG